MSGGISEVKPPVNFLVHRLLEAQASKTPENGALEFYPNVRFTYRELNKISNRLARYLNDHQPMSRKIVATCLEKTHVLVITILAVLKAGMAWVPLPLDAPPARIEQLLRSCDIELVLCSESTSHIVDHLAPCVKLDEILESPELQSYPSSNLDDFGRTVTDLCHILFTSGSTGVPKGVMIEHRAVLHVVWALVKQFNLNCHTRTFQFAAPTFDVFGLDLFMTFASGGCVVMAPISTIVEDITTLMHKSKITYAQLTPTVIQLINPTGVPSLQVLVSTGEALSQNLASQWRDKVCLINLYGLTEATVCTSQTLSGNQIDAACIGRAVDGLEVFLLADGCVEELPEGEVGEICVAGPQLFRGYISTKPDLSLTFPEYRRNGQRYYRTGDLGRMETYTTGEKTVRYLGRRDEQVKVHGIRVDLRDIEQAILTSPVIKQCAVVLPQYGSSASHLCGIIVPRSSIATQDSSLEKSLKYHDTDFATPLPQLLPIQVLHQSPHVLSALRAAKSTATTRLPTHAIPTAWWAVKELPLTSSGKIDRRKLQAWLEDMDRQTYIRLIERFADKPLQPPALSSNDVHLQLLQSLWAEVLNRPVLSINIAASFIDLGADSLDVIRLISKARKAGLDLNYSQVFTARTIQGLADSQRPLLEQSNRSLEASSYIPFSLLPRARPLAPILEEAAMACGVRVDEIEDIYPCTPHQAEIMAVNLKSPMSFVCEYSWTLSQNIEIDRFRFAWNNLIFSEPVLRNRFIWDAFSQDFLQVTVHHKSARWSEEDFKGPISLGNDLCRGLVQRDAEAQRWKFLLKINHSIMDGWSLGLMLNRLKSMYNSGSIHDTSGFSFAHFIRHCLEEGRRKEVASEKFWNKYLKDASAWDFPPLPSGPNHEVQATEKQSLKILLNLQEMAIRYKVTPATLLYATAALILGAQGKSDDVIFALLLAGRDVPLDGIFNMVGPAFVHFPFRTPIDRRLALGKFLQIVERQILDIIPHQDYGTQRIKQCGTGAAAACQSRCLVVVQPEDEMLAGEGLWEKAHGQTSEFAVGIPLSLELVLGENQILINCHYDPAYLSREHVGYILTHFDCVMHGLFALSPEDSVSQVNLAEKEELARMLECTVGYREV